jgi:small subunit ribosomal protein S19e
MSAVKTIYAEKYNSILASALKGYTEFEPPEWVMFVKSGHGKQRPIDNENFWHVRVASILRQIYLRGTVGVQRLRTRYGNRKNRGKQPSHFVRASGKIIRLILQQAESAGLLSKSEGKVKGRILTEEGRKLLENISEGGKN